MAKGLISLCPLEGETTRLAVRVLGHCGAGRGGKNAGEGHRGPPRLAPFR